MGVATAANETDGFDVFRWCALPVSGDCGFFSEGLLSLTGIVEMVALLLNHSGFDE